MPDLGAWCIYISSRVVQSECKWTALVYNWIIGFIITADHDLSHEYVTYVRVTSYLFNSGHELTKIQL